MKRKNYFRCVVLLVLFFYTSLFVQEVNAKIDATYPADKNGNNNLCEVKKGFVVTEYSKNVFRK